MELYEESRSVLIPKFYFPWDLVRALGDLKIILNKRFSLNLQKDKQKYSFK